MLICQSCKENLPDNGPYCPNCGAQTKCKGCQNPLTTAARFCSECGSPVEPGASGAKLARPDEDSSNFNTVIYEDKTTRFSAKLSDDAFHSGSDVLGAFLLGRIGQTGKRNRQQAGSEEIIDIQSNDEDNEAIDETTRDLPASIMPKILTNGSEQAQLAEIFRVNGDELRLNNSRLKQKNRSDFVTRATVLFLYAHEIAERRLVPRHSLTTFLKDAKVYSGNERMWIGKTDLIIREGESIGLSVPGRDKAREFLEQYCDPKIDTPWSLGTKSGHSIKKKGQAKSKEGGKVGKSRKPVGTSYAAQVRKLFTEGYFLESRTPIETKNELFKRGFTFPLGRITEALTRLLRAGDLAREKTPADEWIYKNK